MNKAAHILIAHEIHPPISEFMQEGRLNRLVGLSAAFCGLLWVGVSVWLFYFFIYTEEIGFLAKLYPGILMFVFSIPGLVWLICGIRLSFNKCMSSFYWILGTFCILAVLVSAGVISVQLKNFPGGEVLSAVTFLLCGLLGIAFYAYAGSQLASLFSGVKLAWHDVIGRGTLKFFAVACFFVFFKICQYYFDPDNVR